MSTPIFPPTTTTSILVNTRTISKIVYLPAVSTIGAGKLVFIKDICGNAASSSIFVSTTGVDTFDYGFRPSSLYALMSTNFQSILLAPDGGTNWLILQNYNANLTSRIYPQDAQTYLPLAVNATDEGRSSQPVTTNGTVTYTAIQNKSCAYFSNSLSNYLNLTFPNPTTFTLCYWYYPNDTGTYTVISITNAGLSPAMQNDTTGSTGLVIVAALPNQWTVNRTVTVPAVGNWKFITITINQTTFLSQMYVNGVFANSQTGTGTGFGTRDRYFIGRSGDNSRAFLGYIRQFMVFHRILTADEILSLYNQTI